MPFEAWCGLTKAVNRPNSQPLAGRGRGIETIDGGIRHWLLGQVIEQKIAMHLEPYRAQLELLQTIPGVSLTSACIILAEIGVDMHCWPTAKHLAAWGGVAPGCRESGGKTHRAGTRKGNPYLCSTLVECAGAAVKKKGCHLGRKYRHLAAQTGSKKKALVAIARKLLVLVYKLLGQGGSYEEPKPKDLTDEKRKRAVERHLHELAKLGVQVDLMAQKPISQHA